MRKASLFTIFMVVFIGLMGFSFFVPLLPFYAVDFGASELVLGFLLASYALAQLIGAPILGRLSDRYGRRPVLFISTLGTFLSLLLLVFANSLWMLFASRILDGLTGGNISVAQAYITDITDEKNRARGLGLIGAAFGLGFILGPALGGVLSDIGRQTVNPMAMESSSQILSGVNWTYVLPAIGASVIAFINVLQVIFTLPESLTPERRAELIANEKAGTARGFSITALRRTLSMPRVGPLLNMRFLYGLAFSMFQSAFPLYAAVQLGLGAAETAYILAYVGILAVLVQGVAIGRLSNIFSDDMLLLASSVIMTFGLVGWALAPTVPVLLLVLIPIAFAGGVFNTVINSALTKSTARESVGGILGVSTALESSTRVVGPAVGNGMIGWIGAWSPGILGAIITGVTSFYVWSRIVHGPHPEPRKQMS